ncbi:MAG TPA: ABC transporter permease [Candidatus Limnocylindrales bacterium]
MSAAPLATRVAAQLRMELRLTARRGENVLATLVIPVALLVFFVAYPIGLPPGERAVDAVVPAIVAVAIISAGLVNLGIATAYERAYGVLKRLGATPLTRPALVLAKIGAVVVLEVVQLAVVGAVAVGLLGWRPAAIDVVGTGAALVLGTACFAGLGLLLAGTIRAEATLALANGLFLAFVLVGGVVVPPESLPPALAGIARALPAAALADALRTALGGQPDPGLSGAPALVVLAIWALVAVLAAARLFRWE